MPHATRRTARAIALPTSSAATTSVTRIAIIGTCVTLIAFTLLAGRVGAQTAPTLTTNVGFNSAFLRRGVTATSRFVVDPQMRLDVPLGRRTGSTLSVGGFANLEPAKYDGVNDLSLLGGVAGPVATASQLWAEVRHGFGDAGVSVGVMRYLYPSAGGLAANYNTSEVYAIASAPRMLGLPVAPTVSVSYDVEKIRGAYVEAALSRDVAIPVGRTRRQAIMLSAAAGYSAGQSASAYAGSGYFAHDGITHADVSASTAFAFGGVAIAPVVHLIVGRDEMVRLASPTSSRAMKVWAGTSLSWAQALRRPARRQIAATPAATMATGDATNAPVPPANASPRR